MVQANALLVAIALTVTVPPALADEKQIRRDCTWDALRYCAKEIPQGRSAIISCMIEHKDKLRPKCRQHMW